MKKNQIIVILAAAVLIFGGIIGWSLFQKAKIPPGKEAVPPEEVVAKEIYSLTGVVSKVDGENNFLMVIPTEKKQEVKVIVTEDTKLFKVLYPSEEANPVFVTERKEITIEDIKEGDRVFIKTKINIAGLKEFSGVEYIEVL